MSRRRRAGLSPSLFPFLAVLVCTLGTLILLLALVASEAKQDAEREQAKQAAETAARMAAADDARTELTAASATRLIREESYRTAELVSHREEQARETEQLRDQVTAIESHAERLRKRLGQLQQEIETATAEDAEETVGTADLAMMKQEIETLGKQIEELAANPPGDRPRVVIVPHSGPNATARRPIYVECTAEGVTVWPEGGEISKRQLAAAAQLGDPAANPLDAALREVRHHALQVYGDETPPYPLLVVRPNGIDAYQLARRSMRDWDDQFGYELIPGDVDLAFTKPDEQLSERMDVAIEKAVARTRGVVIRGGMRALPGGEGETPVNLGDTSAPRGRRVEGARPGDAELAGTRLDGPAGRRLATDAGGRAGTSAADGRPGSSAGGGGSRKRLPTLSARELDLQAQSNGFAVPKDMRFGEATSSRLAQSIPGDDGRSFSASGGRGAGGSAAGEGFPGDAGQTRDAELNELLNRGDQDAVLDRLAGGDAAGAKGKGGTELSESRVSGEHDYDGKTRGDGASNEVSDRANDNPYAATRQPSRANPYDRSAGGAEKGDSAVGTSRSASATTTTSTRRRESTNRAGDPIVGSAVRRGSAELPPRGQRTTNERFRQGRRSSSSGEPRPSQSGQTAAGQRVSGPTASGQTGTGQTASSRPGANQSNASGGPPTGSSGGMSSSRPVQRQGRDWALPDSVAGMRGGEVVRPIAMVCRADRFDLLSSGRDGRVVVTDSIPIQGGDVKDAVLRLATRLRDRIDSWGTSLPNSRWQPRLEVQIAPMADQRFHQLETLMRDSGIDVVGRTQR